MKWCTNVFWPCYSVTLQPLRSYDHVVVTTILETLRSRFGQLSANNKLHFAVSGFTSTVCPYWLALDPIGLNPLYKICKCVLLVTPNIVQGRREVNLNYIFLTRNTKCPKRFDQDCPRYKAIFLLKRKVNIELFSLIRYTRWRSCYTRRES